MPPHPHRAPRALVTGAAGFIGCHLVEALSAQGWSVIGIDSGRSGDWRRVRVPCERIDRDITELSGAELTELCTGVEVLFHLAAEKYNSPNSSPKRIIDVNITATERLFEAAGRSGVRKLVFTSSLYAYGSLGPDPMREVDVPVPGTLYGMSKIAGEHLARISEREHGIAWTIARLFFIYGPRQYAEGGYKSVIISNFERLLRGERPTVYGDGEQALDYVYIDDAIEALLAMASDQHDGKVFNVASGAALSVNALTSLMLSTAGSDLKPVFCPPDWTAGSTRVGDPSRARDELGWVPTVSHASGVARVWDWMRSTGHG